MAQIKDLQVRINGDQYKKEYDFTNIMLEQELLRPNRLRFVMKKKIWNEDDSDSKFNLCASLLGATVEVLFSTDKSFGTTTVPDEPFYFKGIIARASNRRRYRDLGNVIEVEAYSPDYLLIDHAHSASFEGQDLASIVSEVLSDYDIESNISPRAPQTAPYIVQYNETSYQFLVRLAKRYGEWFYYSGENLVFGDIEKASAATLKYPHPDVEEYSYDTELGYFNFSQAVHNYTEDSNTSSNAGDLTGGSSHFLNDDAYSQSLSAYKKETWREMPHAQEGDGEQSFLDHYATAEGMGRKAKLFVCRATTNRSDLTIGSLVLIAETDMEKQETVNQEEMVIYKIVHTLNINGEYKNEFSAVPADTPYPPYHEDNLPYPLAENQRAVVIDNKDPEQMGRLRVQFLWQSQQDSAMTTPWIRMAQPHGGGDKGFYFIPEIGEEVMVGFESGNPERPFILGTLYHGQAKPPESWYSDSDDIKAIRTRNGHTIEIHDVGEGGYIRIYDEEEENYILTYSTDEKLIKLESTGNIELHAQNDIIMTAGNNIDMKATVDIFRDAGENIAETAGKNIAYEAGENLSEAAGTDITVEAGQNITESAGENINETAGKDRELSVSQNNNESIGEKMIVSVGENMNIEVAEVYTVEAKEIVQDANENAKHYAGSNWEQKADKGMKIDGGSKVDIAGEMIKIS